MKTLPDNWREVPPPEKEYGSIWQAFSENTRQAYWREYFAAQSALAALKRELSPEQYANYIKYLRFGFTSLSGRQYWITRGRTGNIWRADKGCWMCIVILRVGNGITTEALNYAQYMGLRYDEVRTLRQGGIYY